MASTRALCLFGLVLLFLSLASAHFTSPQQLHQEIIDKARALVTGEQKKGEQKKAETRAKRDAGACEVFTCANIGEPCDEFKACAQGSECSRITLLCTAEIPLGGNCTSEDDELCVGSTSCLNGKCNEFRNGGESCTNDNQCAYYINSTYVTQCVQNRCAGIAEGEYCYVSGCLPPFICFNNTCVAPFSRGEECTRGSECAAEYRCINGTCNLPVGNGGSCDDGNVCSNGLSCIPTANTTGGNPKCLGSFFQSEGAFCDQDTACGDNLMCSSSSRGTIGTCFRAPATPSYTNCTDDDVCRTGEYCDCNGVNGVNQCIYSSPATPNGMQSVYETLINCCTSPDFEECTTTICASQYCSYVQVIYRNYLAFYLANYPKCYYDALIESLATIVPGCDIVSTTGGSNPTGSGSTSSNPTGSGSTSSGSSQSASTNNSSAGTRIAYACACATVAFALFLLA